MQWGISRNEGGTNSNFLVNFEAVRWGRCCGNRNRLRMWNGVSVSSGGPALPCHRGRWYQFRFSNVSQNGTWSKDSGCWAAPNNIWYKCSHGSQRLLMPFQMWPYIWSLDLETNFGKNGRCCSLLYLLQHSFTMHTQSKPLHFLNAFCETFYSSEDSVKLWIWAFLYAPSNVPLKWTDSPLMRAGLETIHSVGNGKCEGMIESKRLFKIHLAIDFKLDYLYFGATSWFWVFGIWLFTSKSNPVGEWEHEQLYK